MKEPALIRKLEAIHELLSRSFVRYIVEAGGPTVGDEWDRKALAAFVAWRDADLRDIGEIEDLLLAEKVHPLVGAFSVEYSQYHYAGAAYLLNPTIDRMEPHVRRIEEEAQGLDAWPEARAIAERVVAGARERLAGLAALDAERPKPAPKAGVKKGVSACRW